MSEPTFESVWTFAVRAYARDGVAPLCLRLQDEHGLDVDVLLGALWLAGRGASWEPELLACVLEAAAPVHARVEELRALRRAVGGDRRHEPAWQRTYEHLRAAELAAERVELGRIEAMLRDAPAAPAPAPASSLALASLRSYAARCHASECDALLEQLVALALPDSES